VHADQAGNHAIAVQVEHLRILWDVGCGSVTDRLYLPVVENNCLVIAHRRARPVDDANMSQGHDRGINLHEGAHFR